MAQFSLAAAQIGADLGHVGANVSRVIEAIHHAKEAGAQLVVFPETILSGYIFDDPEQVRAAARPLDGPEIGKIVRECQSCRVHVVLGVLENAGGKVYNSAVLIGPAGIVGIYRKMHLPYLGLDRFVSPGDGAAIPVFETPLGRIGLAICYDVRFPEFARCLALRGADLIAMPSVWLDRVSIVSDHMVRVRAAENHVYVAAVSRGDDEAGLDLRGHSQIVDPTGEILAIADRGDALLLAEIDPERSRRKTIIVDSGKYEISLFADRRPAFYRAITEPDPAKRL